MSYIFRYLHRPPCDAYALPSDVGRSAASAANQLAQELVSHTLLKLKELPKNWAFYAQARSHCMAKLHFTAGRSSNTFLHISSLGWSC